MFKKIFILTILLFVINSIVFSNEKELIDASTKSTVIAGFSSYYAGCGLMLLGMPFLISGITSGKTVLTGFGIAFESLAFILMYFVGPIISIAANYNLMTSGIIEDRVSNYPGFWYGIGWASAVTGGIFYFLSIILQPLAELSLGGAIALYIIGAICLAASISFMSASVTIPFCWTVKLF